MPVDCGVRLVIRRNGNSALSVSQYFGSRAFRGGPVWGVTPRPGLNVGYPLTADLNVGPNVRTKKENRTVFNATAPGLLPYPPFSSHHVSARRNGPK